MLRFLFEICKVVSRDYYKLPNLRLEKLLKVIIVAKLKKREILGKSHYKKPGVSFFGPKNALILYCFTALFFPKTWWLKTMAINLLILWTGFSCVVLLLHMKSSGLQLLWISTGSEHQDGILR